jgi:exosome complex RNA-binding protein Rrp4
VICELTPEKVSGRGTYEKDGKVMAGIVGRATLNQAKVELVNFHEDE